MLVTGSNMLKLVFSLVLLCIFNFSFRQYTLKLTDWKIENYSGSCYFDTLIHAIWVQILPNNPAYYLNGDTSYLVAKAEVVNKSPIAIFVHGDSLRMQVPVLREWYEQNPSFPKGYS